MIFETERLYLLPLREKQIEWWVEDLPRLEKELDCVYKAEPMEGFFKEIVHGQVQKVQEDPANYIYHTFWFLLRKEDRLVVGSSDFKDVPNKEGEIEIGYGLGKEFEHRGYMTEAVEEMCQWGLSQKEVSAILAETEQGNVASENILKRCGFQIYKEEETNWWRRESEKNRTI